MKKDKIFITTFLIIIFGILIYLPFKFIFITKGLITINSNDNWVVYEAKEENNVLDKVENLFGRAKNGIENRVTNYFPFYQNLNSLYQNINFKTNKLLFDNVPLKTNSDGEYVFYNNVDNFYYLENIYTKEELEERLETQVNFFNNLETLGLDVYIYIPTRYELTSLKDNNLNNYIDVFKSKLNSNIHVDNMKVTNTDEYKTYFYKTDHHWTMYGALKGYYSIMQMFDKSGIENLKVVEKNAKKYYGSLAKSILNDEVYDYITDVDITLDYDVYVNGKVPDELFKPRVLRLDRDYKYYDYYVSYFNGQYGNIVYDYHNEDKESLLILCDSNAWQIDYLIAESFNKTHVINLRYDEYTNKEFDIDKYMKDNDIDKVLFLYDGESILFDQFNYNFIGRVK